MLPGASMAEHLDAVAAVDPDELAGNIEAALRAGHAAGPWRRVAADPARWLRTYVTALRRAWTAFEPLWARSAGMLDREVERVSVALARGAGAELIAERFAGLPLDGDDLLLPSHTRQRAARVRIGDALHAAAAARPAARRRLDGRLRATSAWRSATRSRTRGAPSTAASRRSPRRWTRCSARTARGSSCTSSAGRRPRASSPGSCTASRAWRATTCARSSARGSCRASATAAMCACTAPRAAERSSCELYAAP